MAVSKVGLQVIYRLPDFPEGAPRHRPGVVVQDFGACANVKVHLDESNDFQDGRSLGSVSEKGMATSCQEGHGVGEWRPNRLYASLV